MGQSASSTGLKTTCTQSCKDWGSKDLSTVRVDLAAIHPTLDALCNDCKEDPICAGGKVDSIKTSQQKDMELVIDQENVPPNGFKTPNLNHQLDRNDDASTAASTVLESTREISERLDMHGDIKREDQNEKVQQMQATGPKVRFADEGAREFELKVVLMEWSKSQQCLIRQEMITIPRIHPDLKVADFKTVVKEQRITLKSGKALNLDLKVLTTLRWLEEGTSLNGLKTLAEAGIGPDGPELLLVPYYIVDSKCLCKASSFQEDHQKANKSEVEQKRLEHEKASARNTQPEVGHKKVSPRNAQPEVEQKKSTQRPSLFLLNNPTTDEEHKVLIEKQEKVESWLKSAGFKDINELARKQLLTKTRPLHVAVHKGDVEMIRLLLLMGADPQLCSGKNETPLVFAKRLAQNKEVMPTQTYLKVASALCPTQDSMSNEGIG